MKNLTLLKNIFIKLIQQLYYLNSTLAQSLFVNREDPESRQKTVKQIIERTQPNQGWPQLLIFPEGSTSNR